MLTGRVPFEGESSREVLMKHLTAEPDLSAVREPYRTVIQRALQKDAANRFHGAAEMVAALQGEAAADAYRDRPPRRSAHKGRPLHTNTLPPPSRTPNPGPRAPSPTPSPKPSATCSPASASGG